MLATLQDDLLLSSFGVDPRAHYEAALKLARAEHYTAAANFLHFNLMHDPPSATANETCRHAVDSSRAAAKKTVAGGFTWGDFPNEWKNRLHIVYRLFLHYPQRPADEMLVWIRMLISYLCDGPPSHLIIAAVGLICHELLDDDRFVPPAKVICYKSETATWAAGIMLPPDDDKGKKVSKGSLPKAGKPAANNTTRSDSEAVPKRQVELHDRLFSAKTSARATSISQTTRKEASEPTFRVRFNATANAPQRTAFLRSKEILRDVGRSSAKPYIPGVLLLDAAELGSPTFVSALLQAGVSIYESDESANTAIHYAAFFCTSVGHRAVCSVLLEHGCDPEVVNMHGISAWDCALSRRDTTLRRIFKLSESDLDFTDAAKLSSELHRAIDANDEEAALSLLSQPMPPIVNGVTALMAASRRGMLKVVQGCLNSGSNVEQRTAHGCSAINIAAEEGHTQIIKAMLACSVPEYRLLVADSNGNTPLMRASENGHIDAIDFLLESCSTDPINEANRAGWTALMLAAFNGFEEVVDALLEYGARPEITRKESYRGAQPLTAICYATRSGHIECVRALLDSGISLGKQRAGTALRLAQKHDHTEIEALLRAAGASATAAEAAPAPAPAFAPAEKSLTQNLLDNENNREESLSRIKERRAQRRATRTNILSTTLSEVMPDASPSTAQDVAAPATELMTSTPDNVALTASSSPQPSATVEESGNVKGRRNVSRRSSKAVMDVKVRTEAQLIKEIDELTRQLAMVRQEKKAARLAKEAAKVKANKQPWAFSYSGKWLPGLWAGMWDRDAPISLKTGAPPNSISFAKMEHKNAIAVKRV